MAKSANQKLKLIYLIDKFVRDTDENHGITINDITEYLNRYDIKAERKSLYDDIETLRTYGLDIVMDKSDKKVCYKLVSRDFELAELKLLVDAVQSSRFITVNKTNELIKKLENLASRYEAGSLQRQVYVLNRIKNPNEKIYFTVDIIHRAIHAGVQIEFQYASWNLKKELVPKHDGKLYHVSPWALAWEDENYYLIGYDEDDAKIKHFRVDKMLKVAETDEKRHGKETFEKFDAASYSKKTFGMYGGEEMAVKLRMKNSLVGVIIDRFGNDVMIHPEPDGEYFNVNVDVAVSGQFFGWVLGLGSDAQIIGPDKVVHKMQEFLDTITCLYEVHKK